MDIDYLRNTPITAEQFIALLRRSTLAQRRPVDDQQCMQGVIENSNLVISAWDGNALVGIARSMTDFHYACYLSDLAVDRHYQNRGIGKQLLQKTQNELQSRCKLILVAAPDANSYYKHLGLSNNDRCWILERDQCLIEHEI